MVEAWCFVKAPKSFLFAARSFLKKDAPKESLEKTPEDTKEKEVEPPTAFDYQFSDSLNYFYETFNGDCGYHSADRPLIFPIINRTLTTKHGINFLERRQGENRQQGEKPKMRIDYCFISGTGNLVVLRSTGLPDRAAEVNEINQLLREIISTIKIGKKLNRFNGGTTVLVFFLCLSGHAFRRLPWLYHHKINHELLILSASREKTTSGTIKTCPMVSQ